MHCNRGKFEFDYIIPLDPDEIKDLDGICIIESKSQADMELDIRQYRKMFSTKKAPKVE